MDSLIGVGIYTPTEASRLLQVPSLKIRRWLAGHQTNGRSYGRLWAPEVVIGDGRLYLGFRDLMEIRVADAFIKAGVPAIRIRQTIELAREALGQAHPLSTNRFRTDGREIFLEVIEADEDGTNREQLLNLFRRQYEFKSLLDPILKTVEFDNEGTPLLWWPRGRAARIAVDPARSFGQPIDADSSVPTSVLAAAVEQEGFKGAAIAYEVSEAALRRAVEFERGLHAPIAA